MDWTSVVAGALAGSASGLVASLVAPWVHWGVEKKRQRLSRRRQLVAEWRAALSRPQQVKDFRESATYATLRPHLPADLVRRIESDTIEIQVGGRGAGLANFNAALLDEIAQVESKWKLV